MPAISQIGLILAGALPVAFGAWAAGRLVAPRTVLPHAVRFATGAVILSLFISILLAAHVGYLPCYALLFAALAYSAWKIEVPAAVAPPQSSRLICLAFAGVALLYLVVAISPEIQPDAIAYHLRLVRDDVTLHAFGTRIEFYDVMPQGAQMLFVPAVAIGGYSAAKLVHLFFLLATLPLILHVAHELKLPSGSGVAAAGLFFLSPVAAVDGTSAYVDMALVCASTCTLYLLIRWEKERTAGLLLCAALNAGFCYSVKQTFGWIAAAALAFVIAREPRGRTIYRFLPALALPIVPWMLRAYLLTGDPFAPFLNRLFPNEASTPRIESFLTGALSVWSPDFSWLTALPSYAITGGHQGMIGIAFLLLPFSLLALRKKEGRWLLATALIYAAPALVNAGTRFLLPALIPASLALTMILPRKALPALVLAQALAATPWALNYLERRGDWRLREIPVEAALRIEPESEYLKRQLRELPIDRMVQEHTHPGSRTFAFTTVAEAYLDREVLPYWRSANATRFTEALQFALLSFREPPSRYQVYAAGMRALRVESAWEVRLLSSGFAYPPWNPHASEETFEYQLPLNSRLTDFVIWPGDAPVHVQLMDEGGHWRRSRSARKPDSVDLRRQATAFLLHRGYRYILISTEANAFAGIAQDMLAASQQWGVRAAANTGPDYLFEILDQSLPRER